MPTTECVMAHYMIVWRGPLECVVATTVCVKCPIHVVYCWHLVVERPLECILFAFVSCRRFWKCFSSRSWSNNYWNSSIEKLSANHEGSYSIVMVSAKDSLKRSVIYQQTCSFYQRVHCYQGPLLSKDEIVFKTFHTCTSIMLEQSGVFPNTIFSMHTTYSYTLHAYTCTSSYISLARKFNTTTKFFANIETVLHL